MPEHRTTFQRVDAAIGRVYHWIGNLVGITIGLFAVLISLDLILRLFNIGNLPGLQELIAYALYIGVFLAAPWVLRLGAHVRVDVLLNGLPARAAVRMERVLDLVALLLCLLLLYYGVIAMYDDWLQGRMKRQTYAVAEWILLLFYVLCFLMLAAEFIFRFIRAEAPEYEQEKGGI